MAEIRFTAPVVAEVLALNEGHTWKTNFEGKGWYDSRTYTIEGGQLVIREHGKGTWADSRYDNTYVADHTTTRDALRSRRDWLVLPA